MKMTSNFCFMHNSTASAPLAAVLYGRPMLWQTVSKRKRFVVVSSTSSAQCFFNSLRGNAMRKLPGRRTCSAALAFAICSMK